MISVRQRPQQRECQVEFVVENVLIAGEETTLNHDEVHPKKKLVQEE